MISALPEVELAEHSELPQTDKGEGVIAKTVRQRKLLVQHEGEEDVIGVYHVYPLVSRRFDLVAV